MQTVVVKRILVAFDFGEPSAHALEYAKDLGSRLGASLDVLHVIPNPYLVESVDMYVPVLPDLLDGFVKDATERLDRALPPADRQSFNAKGIVKVGDPKTEVVDYARENSVDLIVMGTHGRTGVAHLFLGSVAERVVRTASCPVLTVR